MLTSEAKRKLMAGGMFGLPMVLVLVTARMVGGPESAEAGETPSLALATIAIDDAPAAGPTPEQVAAAERIAALEGAEFGPTPFHHRGGGDTPIVIEDPVDAAAPSFKVKLIMASKAGNRALIDGTVYTVNEELGDTGWVIVTINAEARSVSIRDPKTGRVRTGSVK